jgi:hypothetical protein
MCQGRYSPKIREDLIPYLYKMGKATQTPMTNVVDLILRPVIENLEDKGVFTTLETYEQEVLRLSKAVARLIKTKTKRDRAELVKLVKSLC